MEKDPQAPKVGQMGVWSWELREMRVRDRNCVRSTDMRCKVVEIDVTAGKNRKNVQREKRESQLTLSGWKTQFSHQQPCQPPHVEAST